MKRFAGLVAMVASIALPAEALADTIYTGRSGQGRVAKVRTGDDGLVERFAINWAADCRTPGYVEARTVGNKVSERRWRGVFRIRVRVLRGSRLVDRCYLRTRWRVVARG